MARDWSENATMDSLWERIDNIAPNNEAEIPIACAMERDDEGEWCWTVDIHVLVRGVTEFDVTGVGRTLAAAARRAYLGMNAYKTGRNFHDGQFRAA